MFWVGIFVGGCMWLWCCVVGNYLALIDDISPIVTTINPCTPGSLCLVYDFLEGGSLAGLLRDRSKGYDLFQVR